MGSKLTVLVPIYDEINLIENFTKKLLHVFQNSSTNFIFIDDGSKDGSNQWLAKHLPIIYKDEIFELIVLDKNYGKGYAIREGLKKSKSEYILCIDSDLEYDPKAALEIYNIAKANDKIDVIYGSRYLPLLFVFIPKYYKGQNLSSYLANIVYPKNNLFM